MWWKWDFTPLIFPVSLREKHKKSQLRDILQNTSTLQSCEGHQNQEKSVKSHSQEEPKDTSQINRMWDPGWAPGCAPGTEKGHWVKTKEIWIGLPWWLNWWRIRLQCRRPGFDPWVGKIPWRREGLPTPVFWPGEFQGLYSPWGCREKDIVDLKRTMSQFNIIKIYAIFKQQ